MITNEVSDGLAGILRTAIVELVRRDGPDLSARQLGVFLTCYLETEAQTVRGLAAKLGVSKPAITRALDRLSEFDLVRRKTDPLDRRSVLVQRTATAWRSCGKCGQSCVTPRRHCGLRPSLHRRVSAPGTSQLGQRIEIRAAAVAARPPRGDISLLTQQFATRAAFSLTLVTASARRHAGRAQDQKQPPVRLTPRRYASTPGPSRTD